MKKEKKNIRRIHNVFGFRHKVHSVKTEIFAGLSTFVVMAYILALAPNAFKGVGGTEDAFPTGALFTAIALVSALSSLFRMEI